MTHQASNNRCFFRPTCDWPGCTENSSGTHGHNYCFKHILPALRNYLLQDYDNWDGIDRNPKILMDTLGKYAELLYDSTVWPVYLSRARIRNRTYNIRKIQDGMTFSIIRHFNAWNDSKPTINYEQIYRYSIYDEHWELILQERDDAINRCAHEIIDALIDGIDHVSIARRRSNKYGNIAILNFSKNECVINVKTNRASPSKVRRLKSIVEKLVDIWSSFERVNYGNMLAYKQ